MCIIYKQRKQRGWYTCGVRACARVRQMYICIIVCAL